jgi:hypothetical protein
MLISGTGHWEGVFCPAYPMKSAIGTDRGGGILHHPHGRVFIVPDRLRGLNSLLENAKSFGRKHVVESTTEIDPGVKEKKAWREVSAMQ